MPEEELPVSSTITGASITGSAKEPANAFDAAAVSPFADHRQNDDGSGSPFGNPYHGVYLIPKIDNKAMLAKDRPAIENGPNQSKISA